VSARHDDDGYYDDHRVRALRRHPIGRVDEARMVLVVEIESDEGETDQAEIPVTWEVCPTCEGRGSHVNPSIDAHGIGGDEFDDDPEFREEYFSGTYDVTCYGCGGRRVVAEIDRERADPDVLRYLDEREADQASYEAECAAERRMGC